MNQVDILKNVLKNEIKLDLDHKNYFFESGVESYENLNKKSSDRYQYILPYYDFNTNLFSNFLGGYINLNSTGKNDLNNTNILETTFTNDLNYKSKNFISNLGFKNNFNI